MRFLITGITGFVGSHMADYLLKNTEDAQIYGIKRWRSREDNIKHLYKDDRVTFLEGDLLDRGSLAQAIKISKPDVVLEEDQYDSDDNDTGDNNYAIDKEGLKLEKE